MTDQDNAGPQLVEDNGPPADRFKELELPSGVDADEAIARISRAFRKLGDKRQARRDREVSVLLEAERAEAVRLNRSNALRTVTADGATLYFGACACRWHGLRVSDPEVALREYDAHPCTIPLETEADHPAFRELRMGADGKLVKRPASALALNQVLPDGTIINTITAPIGAEVAPEAAKVTTTDDTEARFALLELK